MGAKTSDEMKQAIALCEQGMSSYAAAKEAGVNATALRRSAGYQAGLASGKIVQMPRGPRKGEAKTTTKKTTVAAKKTGKTAGAKKVDALAGTAA